MELNSRTALFSTAKLSIFPFTTKQNTLRFLYLPFLTNRTYFIAIMQSALYNLFSAYHRIYPPNTLSPMETLIIRCHQTKSPSDSPSAARKDIGWGRGRLGRATRRGLDARRRVKETLRFQALQNQTDTRKRSPLYQKTYNRDHFHAFFFCDIG